MKLHISKEATEQYSLQDSILAQMRKGAVESFLLHATGMGLLIAMHIVLARLIGPRDYGIYSYALTITTLLALIVPLGWPTALMRFISQYREDQSWGLLKGAFLRAHQITFGSSCFTATVLFAASYIRAIPSDMTTSLRFASLLLPILSFVGLRRKALQGLQCIKASITFEEILLPVLVIACCLLFGISTAVGALWIYFAVASFVLFVAGSWLWRQLPILSRTARPEFLTRRWMVIALPMMFGSVSQMIMNRTSIIILGAMVDMHSVGLYSAASRLANLNTFVLSSVNTIAAPMLAATYHQGRLLEFRTVMSKAMIWSALGSLPLFVLMMIWPKWLLSLLGLEFTEGAVLLQILAFGQFINAATGPVGFNLLMSDKEQLFAKSLAVTAGISVLGNVVAIKYFEAIGAASVTAGSVALLNTWQLLLSKHLSRL